MKTEIIIMVLVVIGLLVLSFLGTALLVKIVCWGFGKAFSWKVAVGIWAILCIARSVFSAGSK